MEAKNKNAAILKVYYREHSMASQTLFYMLLESFLKVFLRKQLISISFENVLITLIFAKTVKNRISVQYSLDLLGSFGDIIALIPSCLFCCWSEFMTAQTAKHAIDI